MGALPDVGKSLVHQGEAAFGDLQLSCAIPAPDRDTWLNVRMDMDAWMYPHPGQRRAEPTPRLPAPLELGARSPFPKEGPHSPRTRRDSLAAAEAISA